jgi:flagellar hook-associated protein 1 FlgK
MSLSGALYNAFSGLKANSRSAALVSTNISNSATESYGRRSLALTPGAVGSTGGVRIAGVVRHGNPVLIADRMVSDAQTGYSGDLKTFASRLEDLVGETGEAGSLTDRVNQFENALITAAANPSSTQRLEMIATTANTLANDFNRLSAEVQDARTAADRKIGQQVDQLNESISRLDQINRDILKATSTNSDNATLLDERQKLLDEMSDIVPLRVVAREKGQIAVFSMNGATLLDGSPQEIGFQRTLTIGAGDTLAGGHLHGLTLNGNPASVGKNGLFGGGTLAAQFEIRDEIAVERQAQLDGMARDLIERLGPSGPDSTLGATDPGLFTDNGALFAAANEEGISGRIKLNTLVEPGNGDAWKLRDGLGATTQGEVGEARLLQGISAALSAQNTPGSSALAPVARSFSNHAAEFSSTVSGARVRAENLHSYQTSQNTALSELVLNDGVDTDQELQTLMKIEQLYAANAKVMSTVDELLERLMSI